MEEETGTSSSSDVRSIPESLSFRLVLCASRLPHIRICTVLSHSSMYYFIKAKRSIAYEIRKAISHR
ncbi:hypothetical protein BDN70DRAFT_19620 [Pholiota conissans]|uniref:Uncharacterized protein n=1 Tax=Pholiota conissans TaxID=109636 RepID=A0A9P6D0N4_9AGAR|nr:hypothetical protein BDN70DRAFT_19620 [Pholiota conissans]